LRDIDKKPFLLFYFQILIYRWGKVEQEEGAFAKAPSSCSFFAYGKEIHILLPQNLQKKRRSANKANDLQNGG